MFTFVNNTEGQNYSESTPVGQIILGVKPSVGLPQNSITKLPKWVKKWVTKHLCMIGD